MKEIAALCGIGTAMAAPVGLIAVFHYQVPIERALAITGGVFSIPFVIVVIWLLFSNMP